MSEKFNTINGIEVNKIMQFPFCQVRAAGKIWSAKCMKDYSATHSCIFLLDDNGHLTGQYSIVEHLETAFSSGDGAATAMPNNSESIVKKVVGSFKSSTEKTSSAVENEGQENKTSKKENRKHGKQKYHKKTKEPKMIRQQSKKEPKSFKRRMEKIPNDEGKKKKTENNKAKVHFHVGAFLFGMGIVLVSMFSYLVIQLAIYEGLL